MQEEFLEFKRNSKQIFQSDRYRLLPRSEEPTAEIVLADDCGALLRRDATTKGIWPRGSRDLARERGTRYRLRLFRFIGVFGQLTSRGISNPAYGVGGTPRVCRRSSRILP